MSAARGAPPVRLAYVTTIAATQLAFLRGQNGYLSARGFELHAIASPGSDLERLRARDGVVPHAVPISRQVAPLRDLVSLWRLFRVLRRIRPHIAHVSTPKAALLGAIAAWAARVPVRIFLMRGLITEPATGWRRALYRRLERLTAALCHRTICVAPSLLAFARAEGIVNGAATVLGAGMSNGVDVDRFAPVLPAPADGAPVIGFVGRLVRDKGVEELARCWRVLREEFPTARLLLVGEWEAEDPVGAEWRAMLEDDARVALPGRVDDVVPYYRRMSVFAFPSHGSEGFPNSPMEAAAMGLPVVATRVVGCVDAVVDGVTGTLVPARDVEALTAALRAYLRDPALRRRHGCAGRERVRRDFRPERIWSALHAEYLRLLAARGVRAPSPGVAAGAGGVGGLTLGAARRRARVMDGS